MCPVQFYTSKGYLNKYGSQGGGRSLQRIFEIQDYTVRCLRSVNYPLNKAGATRDMCQLRWHLLMMDGQMSSV